jgi:MYXO-CTERM domain-containing protein
VNGGTSGLVFEGNAGVGGVSDGSLSILPGDLDTDFVDASFSGQPPMNLFPEVGGALVAAGSEAHVTVDDFNGTLRDGVADIGAYAFSADGNPGWALEAGFKTSTPGNDPGTGGSGGSSGTGGSNGGLGGGAGAPASGGSSGCAVGSSSDGPAPLWVMALLFGASVRRRLERST